MIDRNLTTLEALAMAVRSEIDSTYLYERLAERVDNPEVRQTLLALAADERAHHTALMALYLELLEGEAPAIPAADGREKHLEVDPEAAYVTIIRAARDKERDSELFYKKAARGARGHKTRAFFLELAESERRHATALQTELYRLEDDPDWFDRPDADPNKPIHLGP